MKVVAGLLLSLGLLSYAQAQQNCHAYAAEACQSSSTVWNEGSLCNAEYGNIQGNKQNLGKIMADHLKQSFQFVSMV